MINQIKSYHKAFRLCGVDLRSDKQISQRDRLECAWELGV